MALVFRGRLQGAAGRGPDRIGRAKDKRRVSQQRQRRPTISTFADEQQWAPSLADACNRPIIETGGRRLTISFACHMKTLAGLRLILVAGFRCLAIAGAISLLGLVVFAGLSTKRPPS